MVLWKKKVNGWPPDDPPKGNGTTIKDIETFGDREKKPYMDSLFAYNIGKKMEEASKPYNLVYRKYRDDINKDIAKKGHPYTMDDEQIIIKNNITKYGDRLKKTADDYVIASEKNNYSSVGAFDLEPIRNIKPIDFGQVPNSIVYGDMSYPIFKKPTGNGLIPQLSKVPIIQPETQTSYIKFRPPTPLPEGNVELQNTGYTTVGVKKKPDGTRFIYDRSGKTDKTVIIDDNRIGFEHYIKKLYE